MTASDHDKDCVCCAGGQEAGDARIDRVIRQSGYAVMPTGYMDGDKARAVGYTIGLAEKGLPELIVFGLGQRDAFIILNNTAELLLEGALKCRAPQGNILVRDIFLMPVSPVRTNPYMTFARRRAQADVKALQLVLYDENKRFPWDPAYSEAHGAKQPLIYQPSGKKPERPTPVHEGGDEPVWAANEAAEKDEQLLADIMGMRAAIGRGHGHPPTRTDDEERFIRTRRGMH
jgi:hypothetical protein